jgi:GT2 family glycosyltransferase
MQQIIVNIAVINRPKTSDRCIRQFLEASKNCRDKIVLIVQDQNSNDETKELLYARRKDFDIFKEWEWNIGCAFEINYAMSMVELGQHFLDVNSDVFLYSEDWFDILMTLTKEPDLGVVAGRRPEFWVDRPEKFRMYQSGMVIPEKRGKYWLEFVKNGLILGPFWFITWPVIEEVGYMNEKNLIDDIDYYQRVNKTKWKSAYALDILMRQGHDLEQQDHPQYGSHKAALNRVQGLFQDEILKYARGDIYRGTRFLPLTIMDEDYKKWSDYNWEWFRSWGKDVTA